MNATKTAPRTNTYAGTCANCGKHVAAGAGLLGAKVAGRWTVTHPHTSNCATATAAPARGNTKTVTARIPASHSCDECGARNAHFVRDMSGIGGYACYRCDDGGLSFC